VDENDSEYLLDTGIPDIRTDMGMIGLPEGDKKMQFHAIELGEGLKASI
jgi:hypothetical protein